MRHRFFCLAIACLVMVGFGCATPAELNVVRGNESPALLLAESSAFDTPMELPLIPSDTSVVYRAIEGVWQYNLHSYLYLGDLGRVLCACCVYGRTCSPSGLC